MGDLSGEFWLGLKKIMELTSSGSWGLTVTMTNYNRAEYKAVYNQFSIADDGNYTLTIGGFDSSLSSLRDSLAESNGMAFSTPGGYFKKS